MANLKEVRTRIDSINSTIQITNAMKMVAASKLRKSQKAIATMRPYANGLKQIMQNLGSTLYQSESIYMTKRHAEKILIVPITSNKGLCGVFNGNVIRATIKIINEKYQEQFTKNQVDIFCIGYKGEESLKFKKYDVKGNENAILDHLTYDATIPLTEKLMKDFVDQKYDRIVFIYNQFKNTGTQIMKEEQFLPIEIIDNVDKTNKIDKIDDETKYIYQPNKEEIFNTLIPKSLKVQVYKILLNSYTSEQGARMVAMTKATDNAKELLKELNLTYNKARQSAITNEIVEIVSGSDALKE